MADLELDYSEELDDNVSVVFNNEDTEDESLSQSGTGECDPGLAALGEFLTNTQTKKASDEDHSSARSDDDFINQLACLAAEKQGPEVHEAVATLVNNNLKRDFSKGNRSFDDDNSQTTLVINKFKKYPTPANVGQTMPCRVNDGVFKAMKPQSKRLNSELHLVEITNCKAINAQIASLEKVLELKSLIKKPELEGKFNEVFTHLANSIEFLCMGRAKTNDIRKEQILGQLNEAYKHLASETRPEMGLLFGDNLEAKMRSVESANRLSKRLSTSATPNSFLGRGSARGRGRYRYRGFNNRNFQPYPRQHDHYQPQWSRNPGAGSQLPPPKSQRG